MRHLTRPSNPRSLDRLCPELRRQLAPLPAPLLLGLHQALPAQENPDLTDTELGWLDAAFNATYALGQVPGGLAADIFGPRAILPAITLCWCLAMAGFGWTSGFWRLLGIRAAFGVSQAGAYPILNKVTRNWFPLSVRTSVQGIVAALGRIGAACSGLVLATLLMGTLEVSWRTALVVLAVPGVILAAAWWLLVRDRPSAGPVRPPGGKGPTLFLNRAALVNLSLLLVYAFASTFQDRAVRELDSRLLANGQRARPQGDGVVQHVAAAGRCGGGHPRRRPQ